VRQPLAHRVIRFSSALLLGVCIASMQGRNALAQPVLNPPRAPSGPVLDVGSLLPDFSGGVVGGNRSGIASYESDSSFVKGILQGQVSRTASQAGGFGTDTSLTDKLTMPPLPGEQGMTDSASNAEEFSPGRQILKTGREKIQDTQIRMPTLIGMRQMSNAEPIKKMLLDLSSKKVPVMFQTMMMVENGAATGYIAALNATNGIMQNTMQTHDLQMKFLELTDHTGMQREAYAHRIGKAFEETKEDAWPAALFGALGDSADGKIGEFTSMPSASAFSVADLRGAKPTSNGSTQSVKLSDLLFFIDDAEVKSEEDRKNLQNLQRDFVRYLGDYTIKQEALAGKTSASTIKLERQRPETSSLNKRRGIARVKWEEHAVVYEGLGKVLKAHCEFKKNNPNASKGLFAQKETAAMALNQVMRGSTLGFSTNYMGMKNSPWEYASAPDMPLSFNLVEKLYLISESDTPHPSQLNCNTFDFRAEDIATMMSSAVKNGRVNLDDCSGKQGCVRNRILVFASDVIARSRALHLYRALIEQSQKFAATPQLEEYLNRMVKEEFGNFDINLEIHRNFERWEVYKAFLAKEVQNRIGGSSFGTKDSNNNTSTFVAGR
jgi:hypothetical protein